MSDFTPIRRNPTVRPSLETLKKAQPAPAKRPEAPDPERRREKEAPPLSTSAEVREVLDRPFDKGSVKNEIPDAPDDSPSGTARSPFELDLPPNETLEDQARNVAAVFAVRHDENNDNVISREEFAPGPSPRFNERRFDEMDTDGNDEIDRQELLAFGRERAADEVGFIPDAFGGGTGQSNAQQILRGVDRDEVDAVAAERAEIDQALKNR